MSHYAVHTRAAETQLFGQPPTTDQHNLPEVQGSARETGAEETELEGSARETGAEEANEGAGADITTRLRNAETVTDAGTRLMPAGTSDSEAPDSGPRRSKRVRRKPVCWKPD